MAFVMKDLVGGYTSTQGLGSYELTTGTPIFGMREFSAVMANGDVAIYCVRMGADFEVVRDGAYVSATDDLTRPTILRSSNADAAVNWGVGIKTVTMGIPADLLELLNMKAIVVADSATPNIGSVAGGFVQLDGTTTITGFGTAKNKLRFVRFTGIRIITHNATTLYLPGGANITTAAGDTAVFKSDDSGNWLCLSYTRVGGDSLSVLLRTPFTSSGTYTPTAGMLYAIIECIGGGGGGGAVDGSATHTCGGGGGGAGSYSRKRVTAADVGASQVVTIGAAGAGGAAGANNGTAGGDTSLGALCIGKGGGLGTHGSSAQTGLGGNGGVPGTGDFNAAGEPGESCPYWISGAFSNIAVGGMGGSSAFGGGGRGGQGSAGVAAAVYGSGGGGGQATQVATDFAGGNGSAGVVIITEFIRAQN